MTRPTGRLVAAVSLALAGAAALAGPAAGPAGAHEGPGILVMESDTPTGTSHRYVIRLTWENDGHPAARTTTLTLTPLAPGGAAQTPVPMTPVDDDGRFEATVDLAQPGSWKVRFTALNPSANVEVDVPVAPPTTTSSTSSTSTTTGPGDDEGIDDAEEAADTDDPGSDSGSGGGPIVVGVLAVVAAAAGGALAVAYRSRRGNGPGGDGPGPVGDDIYQ
jgi:hypothetical protein